jgi:hypothetical protein
VVTVPFEDLKDWLREEIRQLAEHFGREFREEARQPATEYLSIK